LKKLLLITLLIYILPYILVYSQDNDSLLQQIKDMDISLNEPVEAEEDLYLNTVSFESFYDLLSPMGEWIQITKEDIDEDLSDGDGEGISSEFFRQGDENLMFIWKPKADKNWKPFMNGKWEYTDHGWMWISADKWGNSTFNYGRWWNSPKYGWVWLPGYTWAPAWVSWRVTSDDNFTGWVALSPKAKWKSETGITNANYNYKNKDADWVFVNSNAFADELNTSKIVSAKENSSLIVSSKKITDIRAEDDKIINSGPDVAKLEEKTGKKFNKKRLRFGKGSQKEKAVISGNEIKINKEKFKRIKEHNGIKEQVNSPSKYKKSDRAKKMLKKRQQWRMKHPGTPRN
jgi:hypothetical protein